MKDINPKAVELLGRGRIHPALHVDDQGVVLGVVTEMGEYRLVTSERQSYEPDDVKEVLAFKPRPYPDLIGRWPDEDVGAFLVNGAARTFSEALALIISGVEQAMELPRPEHRALLAAWTLGSYFFPVFLAFPRLNLSGERDSGKTKLMTLLRATAWNALHILNPTPAVLFRLVHEFRPTLLLDEMEGLNRDDAREVLAIINSGYKAGGTVPRCEGEKNKHVELFHVYAPLGLAGIKGLNPTTEDRCLTIVLQRGVDLHRVNAEVDPGASVFGGIRSSCYRLLLTRWREVRDACRALEFPPWLNGRARELWRPLLAVAAAADRENGLTITPDLLSLARDYVQDRDPTSPESEALIALLVDRLGVLDQVLVRPKELTEPLRDRLGWRDAPTPETVGSWLRRLGFRRTGKDRLGAKYEIRAEHLAQVAGRYTPQTTVTPSPSHDN